MHSPRGGKNVQERNFDQETASVSVDLGDASGFIGHGEALVLENKASRKLLWKIGENTSSSLAILV